MKNMKKRIIVMGMGLLMASMPVSYINTTSLIIAEAHSGRTDSRGGHKDNKNKSGLGSYHYHCGGHPAHLHPDGVCPYSSNSTTTTSSRESNIESDKELIKKVQQALNDKGYDCGKADGIAGDKTKNAIKEFQKDSGLTVDGVIGKEIKKALEIS